MPKVYTPKKIIGVAMMIVGFGGLAIVLGVFLLSLLATFIDG